MQDEYAEFEWLKRGGALLIAALKFIGQCHMLRKGSKVAYKILIIEDDPSIRRELKILLENAMYQAAALERFQDITAQAAAEKPDLILLDVNLPDCCGFDICVEIRERMEVPIIFLTSRTDSMDELNGMLKGGDDYITKPYQASILLARIAAVLKRTKGAVIKETTLFMRNQVELDVSRCSLSHMGRSAELTKNEMKIMHQLFEHPGEYVSRAELVEYLWENQIFIDDNTLSVHVARIREKLRTIGVEDFIETKRGIGYRI